MRATPGSPSYKGYEYQIGVTIWVALDLMLARGLTDQISIEPKSNEDIEAAIADPDQGSLELGAAGSHSELIIQAKMRSTKPWTPAEIANVLVGEQADEDCSVSKRRARPVAMLAAEPKQK